MANELRHTDVGSGLSQSEWEAIGTHIFNNQASGDIPYASSATQISRLAKGTDGDFLASGTPPTWVTHATNLNAHTFEPMSLIRTGQYFAPFHADLSANAAMVASTIYAHPFFVVRNMTIDRLGMDINTAAADKIIRLGIYNDGTNLYPGTLLLDAGTISAAATGGIAATLSPALALTKGLYWLVSVSDGTPTVACRTMCWSPLGFWSLAGLLAGGENNVWLKAAVGSGALADPFVSGASMDNSYACLVAPRLLTLD